ncbi:LPXTG cell wall anchor domain-containing protein [Streptomyces sp. NPDC001937]
MTGQASTVPWLSLLTAGALLLSGAVVLAWSRRLRHARR